MTQVQTPTLSARIYRSYLVRFWQSDEQGRWRASAQCVQTADVVMFGDVDSLLTFLQHQIEGDPQKEEIPDTQYPARP